MVVWGLVHRAVFVSAARFEIAAAGLDAAASSHVQVLVPAGLRATTLHSRPLLHSATPASETGNALLRTRSSTQEWKVSPSQSNVPEGWATGGVAYWRPSPGREVRPDDAAHQHVALKAADARLSLTLALETRGVFTAIVVTNAFLSAAVGLLVWTYPGLHADPAAQDVLMTGILIAPSLAASFVAANREPGVVSRVTKLPRLILLINLVLLMSAAVRGMEDRTAGIDGLGGALFGGSTLLACWLLLSWVAAYAGERRRDGRAGAGLSASACRWWPVGTYGVPACDGPRHQPVAIPMVTVPQ